MPRFEPARSIGRVGAVAATRRDRVAVAGVFLLAASLRVLYAAHASTIPAARYPMVDARAYHERALAILSGSWIGEGIPYQDPLYPYFLASCYALFGPGSIGVWFAQALLDAGTAVLVYAIARRVFDARCALLAGLLAASYKLFLYFDIQLLKVPLAVFLITLTLWLVIEAQRGGRRRTWFAAGASLGLAALTRGNYLVFAPPLLGWIGLAHGAAPRARGAAMGLVALGLAACILPVTLRNILVGGDLVLITSQAGQNFYIGNQRANATGGYVAPPFVRPNPVYEESDFRAEAERRSGRSMKPSEVSRYWFRQAQREIAADPGHFLRHTAFKAALFFNHYEVPDNQSYYFFREHVTPVLKLPLPGYGALLPLALLGMGLGWRRRGAAPLILFFVSYAASVILFYNFSRYRMPVVPVVLVFGAAGLVGIADGLRRRDGLRTALMLGFVVVAQILVHRDITTDNFSTYHFNLALHHRENAARHRARAEALSASGDASAARVEVERSDHFQDAADEQVQLALATQPPSAALRRTLPAALAIWIDEALGGGRNERALGLSRDLTAAFPRFAQGHLLLGRSYARLGRDAEAASALRRALALAPTNEEARAWLERLQRPADDGVAQREPGPRVRVVLITLDTIRHDALGAGHGGVASMPRTAAYARRGAVFTRAYAASNVTQPTHATLFTSLHPWEHGVTRNGMVLGDEFETVAEALGRMGFTTGAVVASFPLRSRFGFAQGFDVYREVFRRELLPGMRSWKGVDVPAGAFYSLADPVASEALRLLDELDGERQFLWFHFFDAHDPYGDTGREVLPFPALQRAQAGRPGEFRDALGRARRLYRADLASLDANLGRVLDRLERDAARVETHVVLTADHGESFGERGHIGHGDGLGPWEIQVPLVIVSPRVTPGLRHDVAGSIDVARTLLSLAGSESVPAHGRDLTVPASPSETAAFGMRTTGRRAGGRTGEGAARERFFAAEASGVYAGRADGLERVDGAGEPPLPPLSHRLQTLFGRFEATARSAAAREVRDDETRRALRELGYVR